MNAVFMLNIVCQNRAPVLIHSCEKVVEREILFPTPDITANRADDARCPGRHSECCSRNLVVVYDCWYLVVARQDCPDCWSHAAHVLLAPLTMSVLRTHFDAGV